jgi:Terminase large subunit, T4likevirus-type, N-terminal
MATAVLRKSALFDRVGHVPHAGQRKIYRSKARNRVCSCGRRFGKSVVGGMELVCECYKTVPLLRRLEESGKRREFWIVGPEYTDSEKEFRVLWDTLKARGVPFDRPGSYYSAHDSDMQLSCFGGRFLVIGKSAKHPERLVGEGLNGVIMAEAAKQRETTWTKFIRPMLSDYKGWALFSSTPEGKNWFYHLWMRGQSAVDDEWESWRMPSWRNPNVYPLPTSPAALRKARELMRSGAVLQDLMVMGGVDPEVVSLMADLSEETFNQEIAAQFTEFVGRVFKEWDDELHVKDLKYNPAWRTYAAVDYGFTNPFVYLLIQVDPFDNIYIMDEFYQAGLTIDEAATEVLERGLVPSSMITFYPDPSSPGDTRVLENAFKVRSSGGTGGELNVRLRYIRSALRRRADYVGTAVGAAEPLPRLLVNRKCVDTIREMNDYRYPKTAAEAKERGRELSEKPMKKDDHAPEALGRFFAGHFGRPADEGKTKVTEADFAA